MKIAMFARFKGYHGNHKKIKSFYDFGGRCLKIRDVCMDFEPYFKVYNLVSVHPKSIILGQMTNVNMIFHRPLLKRERTGKEYTYFPFV